MNGGTTTSLAAGEPLAASGLGARGAHASWCWPGWCWRCWGSGASRRRSGDGCCSGAAAASPGRWRSSSSSSRASASWHRSRGEEPGGGAGGPEREHGLPGASPTGQSRAAAAAEALAARPGARGAARTATRWRCSASRRSSAPVSAEALRMPGAAERTDLLAALRALKATDTGGSRKLAGAVLLSDGADNAELQAWARAAAARRALRARRAGVHHPGGQAGAEGPGGGEGEGRRLRLRAQRGDRRGGAHARGAQGPATCRWCCSAKG